MFDPHDDSPNRRQEHGDDPTEPKTEQTLESPSSSTAESGGPVRASDEISSGDCFVVGVGASVADLQAIRALFDGWPGETRAAFVIVGDPSPELTGSIGPVLRHHTGMTVQTIDGEIPVLPDTVYLMPPARVIEIADGTLVPSEPPAVRGAGLPIDRFLRSLAADRGERSVAVVLAGAASDGALGVQAVKEAGGLVLAEGGSEDAAELPGGAAATGRADLILRAEEIAEKLLAWLRRSDPPVDRLETPPELSDDLGGIIELMSERSGIDFGLYRPDELYGYVRRRMAVHQAGSLERYHELLEAAPAELGQLRRDLLMGVTRFFGGPGAFRALAREVLGSLMEGAREDGVLRAWVLGCSTGEEAYSLAILLDELFRYESIDYEVYATDVDGELIDRARRGTYPLGIEADLNEEVVSRFFTRDENHFRIHRRIREKITFSVHDPVSDPPLTGVHVVSCRDVLGRYRPTARARVLEALHSGLEPGGILFLEPGESISDLARGFTALHAEQGLFRRKEDATFVSALESGPEADALPLGELDEESGATAGLEEEPTATDGSEEDSAIEEDSAVDERIRELEEQLVTTQRTLANTIEELDGLSEDLEATEEELLEAERALQESEERFRSVAERSRDVYWLFDSGTGRFSYVSPAYQAVWGYPAEMLYEDPSHWLDCILRDDRDRVAEAWVSHVDAGGYLDERFRVERWDGRVRWIRLRSLLAGDEPGWRKHVACRADDITQIVHLKREVRRHEARERELSDRLTELEASAHRDPVTSLLSWRGLESVLTQQLSLSRRTGTPMVAVLAEITGAAAAAAADDSLDPDGAGASLPTIARRLRESIRPSDWIARVGPGAFLLLLPDTRIAEGVHVAEKLRDRLTSDPAIGSGRDRPLPVRFGVAAVPPDGVSLDELLRLTRQAIGATPEEDEHGRVADEPEIEVVSRPPEPSGTFARLMAGNGLRAVVQPIHELDGDRVVGFEILVRGPEGDLESPEDLFRASMERRSLSAVDRRCLGVCLAVARRLHGFGTHHVNLFPSTLLEMSPSELEETLRNAGELSSFCLEISEQQVVGDPAALAERLRGPRENGLRIAMDDADFGRNCLEALILLKPDLVKIDRSLVKDVPADRGARRRLRRFAGIARGLGAEIIAEGIETYAERDALAALGISRGQGFLWGTPYPVPEKLH